jgi:eukaryotic-like serine/threonine-protein kinase
VIGKHLSNYEIVSLLGEGGMGTVYLALHPIMGRKAAVKVLKPELARDEGLVTRFFNEARAANAIRHPNIIDIIDVGMLPEESVPYMLMEFLEGESLATRLERTKPLAVDVAVEIGFQTASALAAAHSKGIVHRDLKPDNLFLVPDETLTRGERVKVLDFGIAKLRDDLRGSSMKTRTGAIMGTAVYMSPEQCQGLIEKIDHRTDIYALGIILYEMLCGAPPFLSDGFGDLIIMHVMREPEHPQQRNPAIPDDVAAAILRALAKNPDDRFQSMAELQYVFRRQGHSTTPPLQPAEAAFARTAVIEAQQEPSEPKAKVPSRPPLQVATATEPPPPRTASVQTPTTFRTANGEVIDTAVVPSRRRRIAVRLGSIVALAAAGLGITVLVTRPSPTKPEPAETVSTTPAPEPSPPPLAKPTVAEPEAQVPPSKAFEPPKPPPVPQAIEPEPAPAEVKPAKKTPSKGKKLAADRPAPKPPAPAPVEPTPVPGIKPSIERW